MPEPASFRHRAAPMPLAAPVTRITRSTMSAFPPDCRSGCGMPEIARTQAGVEPSYEAVDIVHRTLQPIAKCARVGHHVGTFQQDGADIRMPAHKIIAGRKNGLFRCSDIHTVLVANDGSAEFVPVVGTDNRRRRI